MTERCGPGEADDHRAPRHPPEPAGDGHIGDGYAQPGYGHAEHACPEHAPLGQAPLGRAHPERGHPGRPRPERAAPEPAPLPGTTAPAAKAIAPAALPADPGDALAARLRAAFADPARLARLAPTTADDAERPATGAERRAAVLVAVLLRPEPAVLLTLRAATLRAHAGQVSFPGGRIEAGETPEAAALREAAEEIGLDPRIPEILGRLGPHTTGTGFHVTPVVAVLGEPPLLTPDPAEVAEAFRYPLAALLDPSLPRREAFHWKGQAREVWVWPHERFHVWGATAAMLRGLAALLRDG